MAEQSLQAIVAALKADVATTSAQTDRSIASGCASDLMSDVLAFSKPRSILLTGLASPQTVRTAEIADILAICLVFGKRPTPETVQLAESSNIPIIVTAYSLFTASGILYEMGLSGCSETA